jgi:hypothetical protein
MKKFFLSGCLILFCAVNIVIGLSTNPLPASARVRQSAFNPDNPYCSEYIRLVAKDLHISVGTLLAAKLDAKRDLLAQLVREGKLTQAQDDRRMAILTERLKNDPCS